MSIFNPNIIQDESDILKQKIYEDMIRGINHESFKIGEKTKHHKTNYIVTNAKVIEDFDKVFVLKSNFV